MGIFDKRKKDDEEFSSPVEVIDLSRGTVPRGGTATAASPSAPGSSTASTPEEPEYGIARAIRLMRTLPSENVEIVVRVVKFTLESANVKVASIIADAARKMSDIENRISLLKGQITDLESQIASRKQEIAELEADHRETAMVKERLTLAEKLTSAPATAPQRTESERSAVEAATPSPDRPASQTPRSATAATAVSGATDGPEK